jgi:hypothetical protein
MDRDRFAGDLDAHAPKCGDCRVERVIAASLRVEPGKSGAAREQPQNPSPFRFTVVIICGDC